MPVFSPPNVIRGQLTVLDRGIVKQFMFNPPKVSDRKAVNYGTIDVPGASHPVYQFGSGGERIISFELYLDADRGRTARNVPKGAAVEDGMNDITDEIAFYQSLLYPGQYNQLGIKTVFPSTVLFTMGTLYRAVECVVKGAPVDVTYWTPDMRPVRATVSLELGEVVRKSKTAAQVDTYSIVVDGDS